MFTLLLVVLIGGTPTAATHIPGGGTGGNYSTKAQCESMGRAHVANLAARDIVAVHSCAKSTV